MYIDFSTNVSNMLYARSDLLKVGHFSCGNWVTFLCPSVTTLAMRTSKAFLSELQTSHFTNLVCAICVSYTGKPFCSWTRNSTSIRKNTNIVFTHWRWTRKCQCKQAQNDSELQDSHCWCSSAQLRIWNYKLRINQQKKQDRLLLFTYSSRNTRELIDFAVFNWILNILASIR